MRVSTNRQDEMNQEPAITEYLERRNWTVAPEYIFRERKSGKRADNRAEYQKMLGAIRRREINTVVVWKINRMARSTQELVNRLNEFKELKVDFISVTEALWDTSTSHGEFLYTILAAFAEFENSIRSETIKAGIARVREAQARTGKICTRSGKPLGRPQVSAEKSREVKRLRDAGKSLREIGLSTGLAKNTIRRVIRAG
jgi:DNA invertase Pin-like site-specific DNA recombinase